MTFPSAWIQLESETIPEVSQTAGLYQCVATYMITCQTELDASEEDPKYSNRDNLFDVYEDLKRAFRDATASTIETNITDMEIVPNPKSDRFRPNMIKVTLEVVYSQDRTDPSEIGCA